MASFATHCHLFWCLHFRANSYCHLLGDPYRYKYKSIAFYFHFFRPFLRLTHSNTANRPYWVPAHHQPRWHLQTRPWPWCPVPMFIKVPNPQANKAAQHGDAYTFHMKRSLWRCCVQLFSLHFYSCGLSLCVVSGTWSPTQRAFSIAKKSITCSKIMPRSATFSWCLLNIERQELRHF